MRELQDFDKWAQRILDEAITEKAKSGEDTIDRSIPIEKNIMYQAQRKYRDFAPDQALNLFLSDKLDDFDRRDLDQNKVINRQRQDNERLRSQVGQMSQELERLEQHSAESDAELERLRTLSGGIKSDIEKRKIGAEEVQDILNQVEALRTKPGVSEEEYEKLRQGVEKKIEDFRSSGVNPEKFAEFNKKLGELTRSQDIESEQLKDLENLVQQAEFSKEKIGAAAKKSIERANELLSQLNRKEQRFKNSIKRSEVKYKEFEQNLKKLENETGTQIDAIRDHDRLQDKEIANLGGTAPSQYIELTNPETQGELEQGFNELMKRLSQQELELDGSENQPQATDQDANVEPETEIPAQQLQPKETEPEQQQDVDAEPEQQQAQKGINVTPGKVNESAVVEAVSEQEKIAYQYAMRYAPLYYEVFLREPDKRRIMRRYARDDVIDALFQSIYNWLFRIGRYAVEDENRLWRTALEILVAQHPYVEYDDLGIDPVKITGTRLRQPPGPMVTKREPEQPTINPEPKADPGEVKESKLPRKLSQEIDTLAENILGEQYSKYLR